MGDEDRWAKVREIVREECERIESRILTVLERHGQKPKLGFLNGQWIGITNEQREAWKRMDRRTWWMVLISINMARHL